MAPPGGVDPGRASEVERDLARYYDQEASSRAERRIDPGRVAARTRFIRSLEGRPAVLEVGTGPGRDASAFVAKGLDVCGVDLSVAHAGLASQCGVRASVASVRALPFAR